METMTLGAVPQALAGAARAEWRGVCQLPGDRWRGGHPVPEARAKKTSLHVGHQGNSRAGACSEVLKWKVGRFCSLEPG